MSVPDLSLRLNSSNLYPDTHLKCVLQVWHDVSDNVAVGVDTERIGHPEVVGVVSLVELDEETVSAVLSLEEAVPRHPDTGETDLDIKC